MRLLLPMIAALAVTAPLSAWTQDLPAPTPRDGVTGIATAIEDRYFDVAKAHAVADALRAEAASGRYDALTDPDVLAQALTARLRPEDGHFSVRWTGQAPPPEQAGAPEQRGPSEEDRMRERRAGYGFREVERLPGNLGYIKLAYFADFDTADAGAEGRRVADGALALMTGADVVIIDLRGNGGGSPAMVGYLASAFVAPDADIYNTFHGRDGVLPMSDTERPTLTYPAPMLDVPLYILTDGGTGSAAESLSYTLQAAGRAVTVGQATAGAANPGDEVATPTGYSIFVSFGAPRNPITGTNWEGDGVRPSVETPSEAALDRARILAFESILASQPTDAQTFEANWQLESLRATPPVLTAETLSGYVGTWGALGVVVEDGGLVIKRADRPDRRLKPLATDLFEAADTPDLRYAFERGADGRISAIMLRRSDGSTRRYQ